MPKLPPLPPLLPRQGKGGADERSAADEGEANEGAEVCAADGNADTADCGTAGGSMADSGTAVDSGIAAPTVSRIAADSGVGNQGAISVAYVDAKGNAPEQRETPVLT